MRVLNKFVLTLFCLTFFLIPFKLRAQAADQAVEDVFTYSFEGAWTYYEDRPNNISIFCRRDISYSFESPVPLAGYVTDSSVNGFGYYICSEQQDFHFEYVSPLYYDGELYVTSTGDHTSKKALIGYYFSSNQRDFVFLPFSTDIPLFSTESEMQHYFETGDDSGKINGVEPGDYYIKQSFRTIQGSEFVLDFVSSYSGRLFFVEGYQYPFTVNSNNDTELINVNHGFSGTVFRDGSLYSTKFVFVTDNISGFEVDGSTNTDTNVPIFSSLDALKAYVGSGDTSGWINKPTLEEYDPSKLHFSSSLGYLQKVQYKNVTPTDVFPYQIYSQITWDNSNEIMKDAYVQFAADVTFKKGAKTYFESMLLFSEYSVPYTDGKYTFLMSDILKDLKAVSDSTVKKVDNYYVRLVKYDRSSSSFLYGGWTRINTNNFTIDTIVFDEKDQDYYIDTDSDSSYSDQMGIDGNYGTPTWGDLSSASADSFKWFFSMLKDLFSMMGAFPSMLKTVFSFLPSPYINCLSLLLMACIIMRILGR